MRAPADAAELSRWAFALGAGTVRGVDGAGVDARARDGDARQGAGAPREAVPATLVRELKAAIRDGADPLGDALTTLRSPVERRRRGAIYTPPELVAAMSDWGARRHVARVLDPGAGSGRFLTAAGQRLPDAELVAIDTDPLALLLCAANAAVWGVAARTRVVCGDFRRVELAPCDGATLFLGNPPYVRHHDLDAADKRWLVTASARLGLKASRLAGLHAHFFVRVAELSRPGDCGAFVTAAEWLDVNYGALVRELFLEQLGGTALHVIAPAARPFANADTTAVVSCFEPGTRASRLRFREVASLSKLGSLDAGKSTPRQRWATSTRWTTLGTRTPARPADHVELGELFQVHRGQVTGNNAVWIAGPHSRGLPERVHFATVTRARELFRAGPVLEDAAPLRRVIDLPAELDSLPTHEREAVERFLHAARRAGADRSFVARHRRAWWSVGLRAPAPILATYMARRPPAFVRNPCAVRHINIAHGLYPRAPMSAALLDAIARHLTVHTLPSQGRTYAGGLTKFEPREMERLLVPRPELLVTE
jgi:adenine-specific DNA-methyltransferase